MNLLECLIHCYNSISPFQTAILLSILFLYILHLFLRDRDVPPGPRGILFFGYWPFLKPDTCHIQLKKLTKKYGDVFSLRSNGTLFIHLGSIKAVKEAHLTKSEYFGGRFTDYGILTSFFKDGIALINGEPWKVLRKFFLTKFREYGMNAVKENTSASMYDALKSTVEEFRDSGGRPIKIADLVSTKFMMVSRKIIFNDEGITQEELQELIDKYGVVASTLTSTNFLLLGNFARYLIFPLMPSYWTARRSSKRIDEILSRVIQRRYSEYDGKSITNLIDCYFKERDDRRKRGDPIAAHFTKRTLISSLNQFVTDGILTVGLLTGIFLSTLVERPEEQEKIYEEILEVIGSDRLPTMEDKAKLPYTNAFIYEVLRSTDFFPLFPSQQCSKETTVYGFKIPEGSVTLVNFFAAHRNPETYENPDEFNPSRFIATPDKPRPELPILFGVGKRSCIGEAFSMIQIFLLVTTIVQNFQIQYPEGTQRSENKFWSTEKVQICAYPRSPK